MSKFLERLTDRTVSAAAGVLTTYIMGRVVYSSIQTHKAIDTNKNNDSRLPDREADRRSVKKVYMASLALEHALATGHPQDKLNALSAANEADKNKVGSLLGRRAVSRFLSTYEEHGYRVSSFEETATGATIMDVEPGWLSIFEAAKEVYGSSFGLSVRPARSYYPSRNWKNHDLMGTSKELRTAWQNNESILDVQWSEPGTAYLLDVTRSIAWQEQPPSRLSRFWQGVKEAVTLRSV